VAGEPVPHVALVKNHLTAREPENILNAFAIQLNVDLFVTK